MRIWKYNYPHHNISLKLKFIDFGNPSPNSPQTLTKIHHANSHFSNTESTRQLIRHSQLDSPSEMLQQLNSDGNRTLFPRRTSLRHLLASTQRANCVHQWTYFWWYFACCGCATALSRVGESVQADSYVYQLSWWCCYCRYWWYLCLCVWFVNVDVFR